MKKDKIASMYKACSAELTSRTNDIFHFLLGEGNFDPKIMVIGFMPSPKEEEYRQNILEDERQRLLKILEPLGQGIEDLYMTYMMKFRPYRINKNGRIVSRSPELEELDFFMPYLEKEISLINPSMIISIGDEMLSRLSGHEGLKVDTSDDQLLVTGILGKSYKLYPLHSLSGKGFEDSLKRFLNEDQIRVKTALYSEEINEDLLPFRPNRPKKVVHTQGEKKLDGQELESMANTSRAVYESIGKSAEASETGSLKTVTGSDKISRKSREQARVSGEGIEALTDESKGEDKKRVFNKIKVISTNTEGKDYVTIVYGGEGYVDDPVLVALERISSVLTELGLGINRIDLYKGHISMEKALTYINDSRGVILATTVEWYGIGYRLQKFLDDCFFSGQESYFDKKALYGVVFTRHSFERDAYEHLRKSWEVLGGREGIGLYTSIDLASKLETNFEWLFGIDKKTESYFRILRQEKGILPVSEGVEKVAIELPVVASLPEATYKAPKKLKKDELDLSSGMIDNYDAFVEKQQEDIKQISSLFKRKLKSKTEESDGSVPNILKKAYVNKGDLQANIQLLFDDQLKENTVIELNNQHIRAYYGQIADVDVSVSGKQATFMKILEGKLTMQRAFMTGEVKAKGDFTLLYKFENFFKFK